jgi:predicted Zn-dependent protease
MGPASEAVHLPAATLSSMLAEIAVPPVLPPSAENKPQGAVRSAPIPSKYDVRDIGARGIGSGVNLYSLEREEAWGRELAQQVQMQAQMVKDPVITEYINRVAQNLVRNSDAKVPFTVRVIDDEEVNAFALPGGFFFVNSGLILAADNEAELAGVMAHEIGHVAARHATKNATRMQILNLASIPLIFVGGPAGYAVRQIVGLAVPMSFLKFSRDDERQADLLGLEYAYAAGYDPAEFVHFFETLRARQQQKRSFIAKAFATHPMTEERIERAQKEIATVLPGKDEYIVDTSEFDDIKARLEQLQNSHHIIGGSPEAPVLRRRLPGGKDPKGGDGPVLRTP